MVCCPYPASLPGSYPSTYHRRLTALQALGYPGRDGQLELAVLSHQSPSF